MSVLDQLQGFFAAILDLLSQPTIVVVLMGSSLMGIVFGALPG